MYDHEIKEARRKRTEMDTSTRWGKANAGRAWWTWARRRKCLLATLPRLSTCDKRPFTILRSHDQYRGFRPTNNMLSIERGGIRKVKSKQAGSGEKRSGARGGGGSCMTTMLDLPFPPCVTVTVHTAAQRASRQDTQDTQSQISERHKIAKWEDTWNQTLGCLDDKWCWHLFTRFLFVREILYLSLRLFLNGTNVHPSPMFMMQLYGKKNK